MSVQMRTLRQVGLLCMGAALAAFVAGCARGECRSDSDCREGATCIQAGVIFGGGICAGGANDVEGEPLEDGSEDDDGGLRRLDGWRDDDADDAGEAPQEDGTVADVKREDVTSADAGACADPVPMGLYDSVPSPENPGGRWADAEFRLDRPVVYGGHFTLGNDWSQIEGLKDVLRKWGLWQDQVDRRRVVVHVPLLPETESSGALASVADGSHDEHFEALGENLVGADLPRAIIRIGAAFNDDEKPYFHAADPTLVGRAFQQVVSAMERVDGAKFEFVWNPKVGRVESNGTRAWPGAEVVDYIGVDVFDRSPTYRQMQDCPNEECRDRLREEVWEELYTGEHEGAGITGQGLAFWAAFAREEGVPMAITDWGAGKTETGEIWGGDNPYFVRKMHEFITNPDNNVAFHVVFDGDQGDLDFRVIGPQTTMPDAMETFEALFAGCE